MAAYTAEQWALLTEPTITVDRGAEILDENDQLVEDITASLRAGGKVNRSNFATIHGTCTIELLRELDWETQRIRLFQTIRGEDIIESTEVTDRAAVLVAQTTNSDVDWSAGTLTDVVSSGGSLHLDLV